MASSSDNIKKMMAEAEEPGMFSNIGKISGQVWDAMPWYDKLALITSPVPVLGTATGVAADSYTLYKEPSALNVGI